jgi:hypothetical protein
MQARRVFVAIAALLGTASAAAHHSGAMFDSDKSVTLQGTVTDFQWTNPHCWIELTVPSAAGAAVAWSVEMGAPMQLYQGGWKRSTLKPGDRIEVVIHPLRDGTRGGLFVSAAASDGKPLGPSP